ncbi:MAG: DUF4114 domain-containing protein [Mangrovicoccus sp.]
MATDISIAPALFAFSYAILGVAPAVPAATLSPVQSDATPLGYTASLPVMQAGSDPASADFQQNALPLLIEFASTQLGESQALADAGALALDPAQLSVMHPVQPRIYFISEGAGYHNSLFAGVVSAEFDATSLWLMADIDWHLVFPDASSPQGFGAEATQPSPQEPLLPGDFVDLPFQMQNGDRLALILAANGAKGGGNIFSTEPGLNSDGLTPHVISFTLSDPEAEALLIMGFEDIYGGGDLDYNDLVIAVEFGDGNIVYMNSQAPSDLSQIPLPAAVLPLSTSLGILLLGCKLGRRKGGGYLASFEISAG